MFYSLLGPRHAYISSKFESQVATTSDLMASAGISEEVQGVPLLLPVLFIWVTTVDRAIIMGHSVEKYIIKKENSFIHVRVENFNGYALCKKILLSKNFHFVQSPSFWKIKPWPVTEIKMIVNKANIYIFNNNHIPRLLAARRQKRSWWKGSWKQKNTTSY